MHITITIVCRVKSIHGHPALSYYLGWEEQKEFRAAEIPFLVHLCTIQQTALRGVELSIQPFLQ
jgi:hypothetical protein